MDASHPCASCARLRDELARERDARARGERAHRDDLRALASAFARLAASTAASTAAADAARARDAFDDVARRALVGDDDGVSRARATPTATANDAAATSTTTTREQNDGPDGALVGDLSAFFFKTASHEGPAWRTKPRRAAPGTKTAARVATSIDDDRARDARSSAPATLVDDVGARDRRNRGWDDDDADCEADLADALRDDDGLVDALLRGGVEGERAAEILAERLRLIHFPDDDDA